MILYIDTTLKDKIFLALLKEENKVFQIISLKEFGAYRQQAEKLLPNIEKLLQGEKLKPPDLKKIVVNNYGGSFTSLRIGVINANALAFALKIPVLAGSLKKIKNENRRGELKLEKKFKKLELVKIEKLSGIKKFANYFLVEPVYDLEPNIGQKKAC